MELLAPGGDVDAIKAAILAGADAVYCGLNKFNARNRAANISFEDLQGLLRLAHAHHCEVFLTLNIVFVDPEIPALFKLLNKLVNTRIDGLIVQDLGLFYLISRYFKTIKVHASTQLTTHNAGQIQFLSELNAQRVNLSRELSIKEIKALTLVAQKNSILTEVFVHGSYCISFSGLCYMSSVHGGNSGNRGRCSQPCRDQYETTPAGKNYPLHLKDNSAFFDLKELYDAGVDSLKIEGRMKGFEYVYTVVKTWKKQLRSFYKNGEPTNDDRDLHKVFNRHFSNAFLRGKITQDLFIDNPMSRSTQHLLAASDADLKTKTTKDQMAFYEEKDQLKTDIKKEIERLSIAKTPLSIVVSGQCGTPLKVSLKMPDASFEVHSETNMSDKGTEPLDDKALLSRLKAINDTAYFIDHTTFTLKPGLCLPFKELTTIKKKILFVLNGSREAVPAVNWPVLKKHSTPIEKPALSVLIDSIEDIDLSNDPTLSVYFQLPNGFKNAKDGLTDLFLKNRPLIPWFPSILIGEDYKAAVDWLGHLWPQFIVTNNSGIAFEAFKKGIPWIAGPFLNLTNSYALLGLKEKFNCFGAFLSNEISEQQIRAIRKPADFHLYYSIYHPVVLMTSRQCLFHPITGCPKKHIDDHCLQDCEKQARITPLKKNPFIVEKAKGNYHTVYNATNFLNTAIAKDFPHLFSGFMIDLRAIKTDTKRALDKKELIQLFKNHLSLDADAAEQLHQSVQPTIHTQYKQGI
ncbi:related to collagenase [Geofilum rubicundum JCM 15548]|uniref:Related to collagenase n=1 Tax=Geofilum rubicundum JCM 15548 TaxID=1236989 RepID=A0A0E9M029_9BACT|nr:related to collagenase [Geofilum rubicundum JCM 15548]